MQTKICITCKQEKDVSFEYFYRHKLAKDGFMGKCKACCKQYERDNKENRARLQAKYYEADKEKFNKISREYHKNNKTEINARNKKYRAENREFVLGLQSDYYYANKELFAINASKYYKANKTRLNKYGKKWKIDNEHKVRAYKHERRALKKSLPHTLTSKQWDQIKKDFNYQCCYCGEEKSLEQEHFVALTKKGEYTHNNIIPSCKSCNCSKSNKDFFEWYPSNDNYNKDRELFILKYLNYKDTHIQQLALF